MVYRVDEPETLPNLFVAVVFPVRFAVRENRLRFYVRVNLQVY